jgi:hypothetical protein
MTVGTIIITFISIGMISWGIKVSINIRRLNWLETLIKKDPVCFTVDGEEYSGSILNVSENASVVKSHDDDRMVVYTSTLRKVHGYNYSKHHWDD